MTSFATTSTGTRIAYTVAGRPWRPTLILTHSLGSDHRMWEPQVLALKHEHYVVSIDRGARPVPRHGDALTVRC